MVRRLVLPVILINHRLDSADLGMKIRKGRSQVRMAHRLHPQSRIAGLGHRRGTKRVPSAIDFQLIGNPQLPAKSCEISFAFYGVRHDPIWTFLMGTPSPEVTGLVPAKHQSRARLVAQPFWLFLFFPLDYGSSLR